MDDDEPDRGREADRLGEPRLGGTPRSVCLLPLPGQDDRGAGRLGGGIRRRRPQGLPPAPTLPLPLSTHRRAGSARPASPC